jgi:hypothetical protein
MGVRLVGQENRHRVHDGGNRNSLEPKSYRWLGAKIHTESRRHKDSQRMWWEGGTQVEYPMGGHVFFHDILAGVLAMWQTNELRRVVRIGFDVLAIWIAYCCMWLTMFFLTGARIIYQPLGWYLMGLEGFMLLVPYTLTWMYFRKRI